MPPRFEHDCDRCRFHGHMQPYDVYTCRSTIVLRYGDEGHEYYSMPKLLAESSSFPRWQQAIAFINLGEAQ